MAGEVARRPWLSNKRAKMRCWSGRVVETCGHMDRCRPNGKEVHPQDAFRCDAAPRGAPLARQAQPSKRRQRTASGRAAMHLGSKRGASAPGAEPSVLSGATSELCGAEAVRVPLAFRSWALM